MTPRQRTILAIAACLLFVLLAMLAFSRLSTGFDFSWLTRHLFGVARPVRVTTPVVRIAAFSGAFDPAGRYRFAGRITAITAKAVIDPVIVVEIKDADTGRYLDRAQLLLETVEPGGARDFRDSLPVPRGVLRLAVTVEVANHPDVAAEGLVLTAERPQ